MSSKANGGDGKVGFGVGVDSTGRWFVGGSKQNRGQKKSVRQSLAAGHWLADGLKWTGDGTGLAPAGGVWEGGGGGGTTCVLTLQGRGRPRLLLQNWLAGGSCTSNGNKSNHIEDTYSSRKGM